MRNQQGIYLSQKMYVIDLLKEKELLHAKAIDTPLEFGVKFQQEEGDLLADVSKYRGLLGKLIYLIITPPDLAFAVSLVSQFMQKPRLPHQDEIIRILKHIKRLPRKKGLFYARQKMENVMDIQGLVDAD